MGEKGSVKYINTHGLQETSVMIRDTIDDFDEAVVKVNNTTNDLLASWEGDGRNQFETQTLLMKSKLDDISDMLYDIYDALVKSEKTYIDTDESVAKQISASVQ